MDDRLRPATTNMSLRTIVSAHPTDRDL